ncbi:MAG TPA: ATP-binding protein [Propionibacteriaceae bacterium]|nr:ATP-binding protein [Propionibacteriaceae bacterium]
MSAPAGRPRAGVHDAVTPRPDADLIDSGYWVVIWTRYLLAAHALLINAFRWPRVAHPWLLALVMAVIIVWSLVVGHLHRRRDRRTLRAAWIDFAIAFVVVVGSPYVLGAHLLRSDHLTAGVYWMFASAISLAVAGGFRAGLVGGLVLGAAALLVAPTTYLPEVAEDLALPVASGTIGMMMDGLRRVIAERDAEQARAAALAERERLSRIVHDGALQVLALVEREGRLLGPEGARLARLASTQEAALRSVLQDRTVDAHLTELPVELTAMLERHQSDGVTVSASAGDLYVDAHRARELDLAVQELIANVAKHAGPGAHAWMLVEQDGDDAVVWFRDDGVGMGQSQLTAAREAGRMGISGSVTGRLQALGGSAAVSSRPGRGVEWELRIPV